MNLNNYRIEFEIKFYYSISSIIIKSTKYKVRVKTLVYLSLALDEERKPRERLS